MVEKIEVKKMCKNCGCENSGKPVKYECDCNNNNNCCCGIIEFEDEPKANPYCCGVPMKRLE